MFLHTNPRFIYKLYYFHYYLSLKFVYDDVCNPLKVINSDYVPILCIDIVR